MKIFKLLFIIILVCCLSIGSLCFVFAATQLNYNLSGKVSYTIDDVFVKVQTTLYRSTSTSQISEEDMNTDITNLKTGTNSSNVSIVESFTTDDVSTYDPQTGKSYLQDQLNINPIKDVVLNYGSYAQDNNLAYAYYFVINVMNYGSEPINVKINNNSSSTVVENNTLLGVDPVNINGKGTNNSEDKTIVIAMAPLSEDVTTETFNFSLSIDNGKMLGLLEENKTGGYYYIKMGSFNGTPIEWRLLSINGGASQCTTSTNPGLSGTVENALRGKNCLFIQNSFTQNYAFNKSSNYRQPTSAELAEEGTTLVSGNYYMVDTTSALSTKPFITDEKGSYILANNYLYSDIRKYLKTTIETDYNLTEEALYEKITLNTQDQMNDKLYLLSYDEASNIFNDSDRIFYDEKGNSTYYWLRSPNAKYSNYSYCVSYLGSINHYRTTYNYGLRPVFKVQL